MTYSTPTLKNSNPFQPTARQRTATTVLWDITIRDNHPTSSTARKEIFANSGIDFYRTTPADRIRRAAHLQPAAYSIRRIVPIFNHKHKDSSISRQNSRARGQSLPPGRSAHRSGLPTWRLPLSRRFQPIPRRRWSGSTVEDVHAKLYLDLGLHWNSLCPGVDNTSLRIVSGILLASFPRFARHEQSRRWVDHIKTRLTRSWHRYVFALFQTSLRGRDGTPYEQTIPTFLTLYIFGFVYELVLVWDALRLKNTIQIIGICIYNLGLLIYAADQKNEINDAVAALGGNIDPTVWTAVKPFLIAIPCIIAVGTISLSFVARKLYDEFAWTIYKHISADLRMKRRYLTYQVGAFTLLCSLDMLKHTLDLYRPSEVRLLLLPRLHHPIRGHRRAEDRH